MQVRKNEELLVNKNIMENTIYWKYLESMNPFLEMENVLCFGTKKECWSQLDKGAKVVPYKKNIGEAYDNALLKPNLKQLESTKDLDFLSPDVVALDIPLPLIQFIDFDKFKNLKHILINNKEEYLDTVSFSGTLSIGKNVESLNFYGDCEKAAKFWTNFKIKIPDDNSVKFISTVVDLNFINIISMFPKLEFVELSCLKDSSVLDRLPSNLRILSLEVLNKEFNYESLKKFDRLEVLRIWEASTPFDCNLITEFDKLKEVDFTSVKKIENVELLLNLKNLENLTIIDCKNPIKKKNINSFNEHQFNYLNIEYN